VLVAVVLVDMVVSVTLWLARLIQAVAVEQLLITQASEPQVLVALVLLF
jgi:hypothetical protein